MVANFTLLSKAMESKVNSCYTIIFLNLKEKGHSIIICTVICRHMGPMYIDTPYFFNLM